MAGAGCNCALNDVPQRSSPFKSFGIWDGRRRLSARIMDCINVIEDGWMQGMLPLYPGQIDLVPTHLALQWVATAQFDPDGGVFLQQGRRGPDLAAVR